MTIIDEIIERRKGEIASGTDTGNFIPPEKREVPVIPFGRDPFVIAEVKKRSPSKGIFTDSFNHIEAAESYIRQGIKNISVITEKNYFEGSLSYLYEIKRKYPDISVLRKDFLISENDIEVSYNSGADALLLIASALEKEVLEKMHNLTLERGMRPLVEIHDEEDLSKVRSFKPELVGINSRNLKDFSVDMISPLILKDKIDWGAEVVYESGIGSRSDAFFAFSSGFSGMLTGESVIKDPSLVSVYTDAFYCIGKRTRDRERCFWNRIFKHRNCESGEARPLVKICGITSRKDSEAALSAGADMIGMVFAPSVRKADITLPYEISEIDIPKVAVVVNPDDSMMETLRKYYEKGLVDALQFSGDEPADFCNNLDIPFYKAIRISNADEYDNASRYRSVRILTDSFSAGSYGGTGRTIPGSILDDVRKKAGNRLWLAGGISCENAGDIIDKYSPELIDASSSLESSPGVKDHGKMKLFIRTVKGNL